MKSYSFLEESQNQFFKRLSRYTPEEQKRIVDKLFQIGKQNGGFYDRNYLASKIYDGQLKRIGNLAKKNGRKVSVNKEDNPKSWMTTVSKIVSDKDINRLSKNYFINSKPVRVLSSGKDLVSIPDKKGKLNLSLINKDNVINHEADEYSEILKWAKRYKISPQESMLRSSNQSEFPHQVGNVLKRENKRSKRWKLLFPDFKRLDRSVPELRTSSQNLSKDSKLEKMLQDKLDQSKLIHRFYDQ